MRLTKMMRNTLTQAQASRYRVSSYQQKRRILDEFVASTGYNRKYASHLLSHWGLSTYTRIDGELVRLKAGRARSKIRVGHRRYDERVDEALCKCTSSNAFGHPERFPKRHFFTHDTGRTSDVPALMY
jgi:hypothetical protein